jgi:hypothetical protein
MEAVMKTVVALLVIIAAFGLASWAEEESADAKAIQAAVTDYVEGWFSTDPERLSKAMHPNLSKVTIKKVPNASTEYLDIMSRNALVAFTKNNKDWVKGKKGRTVKIVFQDEQFAVVHAVSDDFYDICGLVKLNGEWKIVHVLWGMNETES